MKKIYAIIAALSILLLCQESLATEDTPLTLVVGNCRRPGGVKESSAILVEQDKADFTHSKSFIGRVVSVDICSLQPHLDKYPHLTIDFAHTSSHEILQKLDNIHPIRVFFEWFPSCVTQTPKKNIAPLLLPALKNAFEILSPGGELIIDHNPYVLSLPDSSKEAFKSLLGEKLQVDPLHLRKAVSSHERLEEPGILSHFLQTADPFTLHICREERVEIRNYLIFRIKNNDAAYDDAQCQFIKGKDQKINLLISRFSSALDMDKVELMIRISNGMLYSYQAIKEEEQGYWDLFEQHYYMKTRGPLILKELRNIGFSAGSEAIQYYEVNPHNKRKHAWLISAKKPTI